MDAYSDIMFKNGLRGMIGKGTRSRETIELMKQYGCVYFAATGGAAADIAKSVKSCELIAYPELQSEAIYRLGVEDFTCIVAIDSCGVSLYKA
jgi:fumarate hydratase subunit beta